jgi:hydroxymethylpyrimidine/phosphomethylpyrimidine kinase
VARALDLLPADVPIVLDPVMVSESGSQLLEPSARDALIELLLPRVAVTTPNVPEARSLTGLERASSEDLARGVHALGPRAVVVTGGHREAATDVFFDGTTVTELPGPRYGAGAAHGSGCTHSSVLAARLAWGDEPVEAARRAKEIASAAVRDGLAGLGAGAGPVSVFGRPG